MKPTLWPDQRNALMSETLDAYKILSQSWNESHRTRIYKRIGLSWEIVLLLWSVLIVKRRKCGWVGKSNRCSLPQHFFLLLYKLPIISQSLHGLFSCLTPSSITPHSIRFSLSLLNDLLACLPILKSRKRLITFFPIKGNHNVRIWDSYIHVHVKWFSPTDHIIWKLFYYKNLDKQQKGQLWGVSETKVCRTAWMFDHLLSPVSKNESQEAECS